MVFQVCGLALGDPPSDCATVIVAFSSFATASVFSERPLTADVVFPAMSLFMLLSLPLALVRNNILVELLLLTSLCTQSSQVVSNIMEALVSVRRISDFLRAEELQKDAVMRIEKEPPGIGEEVLSIKDGDFKWTKNSIQPTLEGINLTVRKGELVGILGRVGAGKVSTIFCTQLRLLYINDTLGDHRAVFCLPSSVTCRRRRVMQCCPVAWRTLLRILGV